ncbi:MAG: NarK family nitrate/nitrite MFS transporter [Candidatus Lambdaproteobacteria bacterium]|nr:NarK family nitrate/nitrite MFS transporter [Candidatus Lambdaproteobacteria bacterium]
METPTQTQPINLLSFTGRTRILHMTWFAFFLTFVMWFNHAPLLASIRASVGLTDPQLKVLLLLNVALTIPARIVIGMLVDTLGPRLVYAGLLALSSGLCFAFALADSFAAMALTRFLLGFVGAGFVIGIRMIGEWFPARQLGLAEGLYGGWGNFGSAAAALTLPALALLFGGSDGWRYAVGLTGIVSLVYSLAFYFSVSDTPKGSTYFKPNKRGAMEVSSRGDLIWYLVMNVPMYGALGLLVWKLSPAGLHLFGAAISGTLYALLAAVYLLQGYRIYQVNKEVLAKPVPEMFRYKFKQVAVLDLAYLVTFGSELAVVSMLPLYFLDTFGISQVQAGLLASGYAFMNLFARPGGGMLSDLFGRKRTLVLLLVGLAAGYFAMFLIDSGWPLTLAVLVTMGCSFFVQAGEGAVFAMVPLIRRRLTGQIAGMVGAYGNVGAVLFLTVYSLVSPQTFFLVIAGSSMVALAAMLLIEETRGRMAEVLPDGTVEFIEVG